MNPVAQAYVQDLFSKFPAPNAPAAGAFASTATLSNIFNFREDMIRLIMCSAPNLP